MEGGGGAQNEPLIPEATREAFGADPRAPVSAVAERPGLGLIALYRRHESKEELLRRLYADGPRLDIVGAEAALDDGGDPWGSCARFVRRIVDAAPAR